MSEFTAKDYKKGQPRWCPGCGDHFFLASLHKAMAEIGVAPWETAVISGIGRQWEREYGDKILTGSHNPTIRISSL